MSGRAGPLTPGRRERGDQYGAVLDHLRDMSKVTKLNLPKTAADAGAEKLKKVLPLYATFIRENAP